MKILSYWPYIVYILSGLLFIAAGSHPAWMLVPLTCACIGGSVKRSRVECAKSPQKVRKKFRSHRNYRNDRNDRKESLAT